MHTHCWVFMRLDISYGCRFASRLCTRSFAVQNFIRGDAPSLDLINDAQSLKQNKELLHPPHPTPTPCTFMGTSQARTHTRTHAHTQLKYNHSPNTKTGALIQSQNLYILHGNTHIERQTQFVELELSLTWVWLYINLTPKDQARKACTKSNSL